MACRTVLLACALQACTEEGFVFTPDGDQEPVAEPSQPTVPSGAGTCECSALPQVDPRVPWTEGWESVAYRPGGGGIALKRPMLQFGGSLQLMLWGADGSVESVPSPDSLQGRAAS